MDTRYCTIMAGQHTLTIMAGQHTLTVMAGQHTLIVMAGQHTLTVMAGRVPAIRARIGEARSDPLFRYKNQRQAVYMPPPA